MPCLHIAGAIVTMQADYKPGDPAPEGYLAWHEWAEIQHKAGLRQVECPRCGKWKYPQELSGQIDSFEGKTRRGKVVRLSAAVCVSCITKPSAAEALQEGAGE